MNQINEIVANSLFSIAEEELQCSKLLYRNKKYSKSLYMFQQSVEKLNKACALLLQHIKIDELPKVGHSFSKLLIKSIDSYSPESRIHINQLMNVWDETINEEEIYSDIKSLKNEDHFYLSQSAFDELFQEIKNYRKFLKKTMSNKTSVDIIAQIAIASGKGPEIENVESMPSFTKDEVKDIVEILIQNFSINLLGMITSPHSEQTRYPFIDKSNSVKCPIKIYTLNFPLIENLSKLIKIAEKALTTLRPKNE